MAAPFARLDDLEVLIERARAIKSLRHTLHANPGSVRRYYHLRFPEPRSTYIVCEEGHAPHNRGRNSWEKGLDLDIDLMKGLHLVELRRLRESKHAQAILKMRMKA